MSEDRAVEYVEVSIEEFLSGRKIDYDIFIRLSENKYVKLANRGEDLTPDRLERYKEHKLKALYLRREDFLKYVGISVKAAAVGVQAAQTEAQKLDELCHLGDLTLELIFFNDMNEVVFGTAKSFVENTISVLTEGRHAFGLLAPLDGIANFVYAHGVAVSAYSVMIARAMGWTNSANIFKIAVGGLLHDIGKRDLPRKMLLKPKSKLTVNEARKLFEHPALGVKILESLPSIHSDILDIVLQHHENMMGQGYPNKTSAVHIHPMARIVGLANAFCDLVLRGVDGPGLKPQEAIEQLAATGEYDPEAMAALKHLFKGS